jgi:hypothetical protein
VSVESRLVGNLLGPTWEFANFLKTSLTVPDVSQQAPEMGKKMKLFSFKKQRLQTAIVLNQQRHLQDHELNVIIDPAIDAAETTESFFTNSSDPASFSTTLESESVSQERPKATGRVRWEAFVLRISTL